MTSLSKCSTIQGERKNTNFYRKPETVCLSLSWRISLAAIDGALTTSAGVSLRKNLPLRSDCEKTLVKNQVTRTYGSIITFIYGVNRLVLVYNTSYTPHNFGSIKQEYKHNFGNVLCAVRITEVGSKA